MPLNSLTFTKQLALMDVLSQSLFQKPALRSA